MPSFDPATVRKAVEDFTPRRPQKFQDLLPAKDVIGELRQKRASYRAIAELLTEHCLPTSKTAIATFCHEVLNEIVRPHRRLGRRRPPAIASANGTASDSKATSETSALTEQSPNPNGNEASPARTRGPRIAQVRMLKPETT